MSTGFMKSPIWEWMFPMTDSAAILEAAGRSYSPWPSIVFLLIVWGVPALIFCLRGRRSPLEDTSSQTSIPATSKPEAQETPR